MIAVPWVIMTADDPQMVEGPPDSRRSLTRVNATSGAYSGTLSKVMVCIGARTVVSTSLPMIRS